MGYGFDWAWSGLDLVFMGPGWAWLRILESILNTGLYRLASTSRYSPTATDPTPLQRLNVRDNTSSNTIPGYSSYPHAVDLNAPHETTCLSPLSIQDLQCYYRHETTAHFTPYRIHTKPFGHARRYIFPTVSVL